MLRQRNLCGTHPAVLLFQLGDRGMGGMQHLLWPDGMAASLGELPTSVKHGAAAAFCAQQILWHGPAGREANLQPLPMPHFLEGWALDSGTTSYTSKTYGIQSNM